MVGIEDDQFAEAVMSCVEPSLSVATAVICKLVFTDTVPGLGVTAIEVIGALMVRPALPLTPLREAVIVATPVDTAVTLPIAFTVATFGAEDVQDTLEPRVRELPSLYLPVAVNCPEVPATSDDGPETLIELRVGLFGPPLLLLEPPPQPTRKDVKANATVNVARFARMLKLLDPGSRSGDSGEKVRRISAPGLPK
jgi:hypothetical protein